jgi:hypothetical protein
MADQRGTFVAQAAGLLYRRLPVCQRRSDDQPSDSKKHQAGWQPAVQQASGLRYAICVRSSHPKSQSRIVLVRSRPRFDERGHKSVANPAGAA